MSIPTTFNFYSFLYQSVSLLYQKLTPCLALGYVQIYRSSKKLFWKQAFKIEDIYTKHTVTLCILWQLKDSTIRCGHVTFSLRAGYVHLFQWRNCQLFAKNGWWQRRMCDLLLNMQCMQILLFRIIPYLLQVRIQNFKQMATTTIYSRRPLNTFR